MSAKVLKMPDRVFQEFETRRRIEELDSFFEPVNTENSSTEPASEMPHSLHEPPCTCEAMVEPRDHLADEVVVKYSVFAETARRDPAT